MKRYFSLFKGLLVISGLLLAGNSLVAAPKNEALQRLKSLPPPLQSASGNYFVSCTTAERAALRWPLMRFAETVGTNLSETFLPLGSTSSPLAIEIGAQTNAVTTIERRTYRTGDGFSQLVIRVPNPETVDLEILREGVAEALLRERVRTETGRYSSFTWPTWFLRAVVNASKGNLWKTEAYERLQIDAIRQAPITLDQILLTREHTTPEADAFFALWLLEETGYLQKENRLSLLTTPWSAETLRQTLEETQWQAWLQAQTDRIFLPGTLTRSQFKRWKESLTDPIDSADAVTQANGFGRAMLARPRLFRDLCDLYLKAYTAYISEGEAAYKPLRRQADEAAAILEQHFLHNDLLTDEALIPAGYTLTHETPPTKE